MLHIDYVYIARKPEGRKKAREIHSKIESNHCYLETQFSNGWFCIRNSPESVKCLAGRGRHLRSSDSAKSRNVNDRFLC